MTITDRDRRRLYERIAETLGESEAETLMELLPQQPYTELATRQDVLATASTLRGEMAELRGELRGEMAELRGEMAELRAELRGEMAELRSGVSNQIAGLQRWAAGILAANGVALITALVT